LILQKVIFCKKHVSVYQKSHLQLSFRNRFDTVIRGRSGRELYLFLVVSGNIQSMTGSMKDRIRFTFNLGTLGKMKSNLAALGIWKFHFN